MAAFLAASLDDGSTGSCAHTRPEAMLPLAAANIRLISALHGEIPRWEAASERQITNGLNPCQRWGSASGSAAGPGSRKVDLIRERLPRRPS